MKRAGIITFHNAENYGAALQTYALMTTLAGFGLEVNVVDYRNRGVFIRNLLKNLFYLATFQNPVRNHSSFRDFQKGFLNLTAQAYRSLESFANHASQFDFLFFGSDQIWNPDLANGFDPLYFGQFHTSARKIAYAASLGKDEITPQERQRLNFLIRDFDAVGVREETMLPLIDREADCVVDPCMLLPAERWREIAADNPVMEDFIFIYQLFRNSNINEAALQLANTLDKEVYILSPYPVLRHSSRLHKIGRITPNEFINYFQRAGLVLSDSFHGNLFSILFEKPFYTFLPPVKTGRITTLLDKLRLSHRIAARGITSYETIDYQKVKPRLALEVQSSLDFIRESIQ